MRPIATAVLVVATTLTASAQAQSLPGVSAAMQEMVARQEVPGIVTAVVSKDRVLHLEALGVSDLAAKRPMTTDTLFWIASMTKAITTAAGMQLVEQGKLSLDEPIGKL